MRRGHDRSNQKNTAGNSEPGCIGGAEQGVVFDKCIGNIQQNIRAAAQLKKRAVGKYSCRIPFGHAINFSYVQAHQAHMRGINGGISKGVPHLHNIDLVYQQRVIFYFFNNALYPLFAAELKMNDTARNPGLYNLVAPLQYQQIGLRKTV